MKIKIQQKISQVQITGEPCPQRHLDRRNGDYPEENGSALFAEGSQRRNQPLACISTEESKQRQRQHREDEEESQKPEMVAETTEQPSKTQAKHLETASEELRVELKVGAAKSRMGDPLHVNLRRSEDECAKDKWNDKPLEPLPDVAAAAPYIESKTAARSGQQEEQRHNSIDHKSEEHIHGKMLIAVLNVPIEVVKETGIMKNEYHPHGQNPQPVDVVAAEGSRLSTVSVD